MRCPRCGQAICNCLLEDPGFLARAVGKQLRLSGSEAQGLTTMKSEAAVADDPPKDNGGTHLGRKAEGRRVIYFVNHKVFNALTPGRLKEYEKAGWGLTHFSVWDVKKWFGRYYLIIWEKGEPSIIGIPGRLEITLKGGNNARTIAGGGDAKDNLQNTETPPSLCQWIFERLADAGIHPKTILDPCAGNGNLTRPFRPRSQVIEYEINQDRDFFRGQGRHL